jgi:hypothetical protein
MTEAASPTYDRTVAAEHTYRYPVASWFGADPGDGLMLATSGGDAPPGRLLSARVAAPRVVAQALIAVADVAGSRFFTTSQSIRAAIRAADPVVTCSVDGVRFESFSTCCSVYARLDVDAGLLDGELVRPGTTNVDLNPPTVSVLAAVRDGDPLQLTVGVDAVEIVTARGAAIERRVALPTRWVKGFGETQAAGAAMYPALDLTPAEARRLLAARPRGGEADVSWIVPAGRGLRFAGRPAPHAVPIAGAGRLRPLERLLAMGASLRVYAPRGGSSEPAASAWVASLDGVRMIVMLSPESSRGFSGEGAVLQAALVAEDAVVAAVEAGLGAHAGIDPHALAAAMDVPVTEVVAALAALAGAGRLGYDLHREGWFARTLPFDPGMLASLHPRLASARALVDAGAVTIDGAVVHVRSRGAVYLVRTVGSEAACTCAWASRYGTGRGPCKHVLAADAARRETRVAG